MLIVSSCVMYFQSSYIKQNFLVEGCLKEVWDTWVYMHHFAGTKFCKNIIFLDVFKTLKITELWNQALCDGTQVILLIRECALFVKFQTGRMTNQAPALAGSVKQALFFFYWRHIFKKKSWLQEAESWSPSWNPPLNRGGNQCWERLGKISLCWAFGTPIIQAGQHRQGPNLLNFCLLHHLLDMIYTQASRHLQGSRVHTAQTKSRQKHSGGCGIDTLAVHQDRRRVNDALLSPTGFPSPSFFPSPIALLHVADS